MRGRRKEDCMHDSKLNTGAGQQKENAIKRIGECTRTKKCESGRAEGESVSVRSGDKSRRLMRGVLHRNASLMFWSIMHMRPQ